MYWISRGLNRNDWPLRTSSSSRNNGQEYLPCDTQVPSVEDTLHFLACCPHQVARIRLLERRDSNTIAYPVIRSALQVSEEESSEEGIPSTGAIYDLNVEALRGQLQRFVKQ
jgi:hypothetical protein